MMKVCFLTLSLMIMPSWGSLVLSASLLVVLVAASGKHDLDWYLSLGDLGVDNTAWLLVLLSAWVFLLIFMNSYKEMNKDNWSSVFKLSLVVLLGVLIMAFSALNMMKFYIWFELSLLPTFLLVVGWGYQPERIKAVYYLILYTVFASLPLLLFLNYLADGGMIFFGQLYLTPSGVSGWLIVMAALLAFLVKLPLYFSHLWLIKAHVEAPVAGSMILASILLKLGGFGALRVAGGLAGGVMSVSSLMVAWSLIGGGFVSFLCMRHMDVKALIALSSVAHMGMVIGGIFTLTCWGVSGAVLIMIGHGFSSSGLFCIANMSYLRASSRSFYAMKGLQIIAPALTLWWFLLVVVNMAAPPSVNLLGEIHSISALVGWSVASWVPLSLLTFLAVAYSLILFMKSQHGSVSGVGVSMSAMPSEMLVLFLHWLPVNLLVVKWSSLSPII